KAGKRGAKASSNPGPVVRGKDEDRIGGVRVTHPDRVLYRDQGVTKRDLAEYYLEIADRILPFLKERPISIVRCPQGQEKECFYQRHKHRGAPKELGEVVVPEKEGEGEYLL